MIRFFQQDTITEIKRKQLVDFAVLGFANLPTLVRTNQYTIMPEPISGDESKQIFFLRHGDDVKLRRTYSIQETVEGLPGLREEAFDQLALSKQNFSCYSHKAILQNDRRTRKVHLTDCVDGVQIWSYANQYGNKIKVHPYDASHRARIDGAQIAVEVPSREGDKKYEIMFRSIPLENIPERFAIALGIFTDHSCGYKRNRELKYNSMDSIESSNQIEFCAHEIAGYLGIIDFFKNEKNLVPLECSPFAIPSQATADFNTVLKNNVLLRTLDGELRKPKIADREWFNWQLVRIKGNAAFYARDSLDGKLSNYNWSH